MSGLWLSIPAYIAFVFLVYHHYRYRGGLKPTLGFFGFALVYGIIRENVLFFLNPAYNLYGFVFPVDIWIGFAPLVVPVGWTFSAYTSWYLASMITGIDKPLRSRMPVVATLAGLISATISLIIEMPAVAALWWEWNFDPAQVVFFGGPEGLPILTLGGWAMTVGVFLFCYWAIAYHKTRWRYAGIAGIVFLFTWLVVVNTLLTV